MNDPESPPTTNDRHTLRWIAAGLIIGAPIVSIIPFAILATIIGEDRLEGPDGATGLGNATLVAPAALGLVLLAWSFTAVPLPNRRVLMTGLIGAGIVLVGLGGLSVIGSPGDASIGGGVLVLFGMAMVAGGMLARRG